MKYRYTLEVIQYDWFDEPITITDIVLNGYIAQSVCIKDNQTNTYYGYDNLFSEQNKDYATYIRFEDALLIVGRLNQAITV